MTAQDILIILLVAVGLGVFFGVGMVLGRRAARRREELEETRRAETERLILERLARLTDALLPEDVAGTALLSAGPGEDHRAAEPAAASSAVAAATAAASLGTAAAVGAEPSALPALESLGSPEPAAGSMSDVPDLPASPRRRLWRDAATVLVFGVVVVLVATFMPGPGAPVGTGSGNNAAAATSPSPTSPRATTVVLTAAPSVAPSAVPSTAPSPSLSPSPSPSPNASPSPSPTRKPESLADRQGNAPADRPTDGEADATADASTDGQTCRRRRPRRSQSSLGCAASGADAAPRCGRRIVRGAVGRGRLPPDIHAANARRRFRRLAWLHR